MESSFTMLASLRDFFNHHIIFTLGILLFTGFFLGKLSQKVKLPAITGYIIAGLLLGDSVTGMEITLLTAALNEDFPANPLGILMKRNFEPFREVERTYTICGIVERRDEFSFDRFRGGLFVPELTAREIPRVSFSSVWDILGGDKGKGTYSSIYVRVDEMEELTAVRKKIESMGVGVFAIADQLREIKRGFLIMDSLLGAIGSIALIIAALGIINTMLMSILERTREIGIMKAVGGSENEIKFIFFIEAACIGLVGALFAIPSELISPASVGAVALTALGWTLFFALKPVLSMMLYASVGLFASSITRTRINGIITSAGLRLALVVLRSIVSQVLLIGSQFLLGFTVAEKLLSLHRGEFQFAGTAKLLANQAAMRHDEDAKRVVVDCEGDSSERESFLERTAGCLPEE